MPSLSLVLILVISILTIYGEPWYSIPLKLTANNEHFVTRMSFGSPVQFYLDIIMDTGSGKFHIYRNQQNNITTNNIIPYDTNSFKCICQSMIGIDKQHPNNAYLIELNNTWYEYEKLVINNTNNTNTTISGHYTSFLSECPLWNETRCHEWGEQCGWDEVMVYYQDDDECQDDDNNNNQTQTNVCTEKVCKVRNGKYGLIINGETVSFECDDHCYSGVDIISFKDVMDNNNNNNNYMDNNYVPYVYTDSISLDKKEHNISLFNNVSWADGTLGLVYDYNQQTSFWQILGVNEQHSALLAFDTLQGQIDIGNISNKYDDRLIDYSENIWWNANYHYFYLYSLSVCNINLFNVLNLGSYWLAMVDTGASCLTLPPEIFDLLFKYIPYSFNCDGNQSFCYIVNNIQSKHFNDYTNFPMLSFKVNLNDDNSNTFYVSLKDLIIKLSDDKGTRYCIERGKHSINNIEHCTPDPSQSGNNNKDCTSTGIIIFGTKVLNSLYTIFDFPNKRMGFANNIITNYTKEIYERVNKNTCKVIQTNCIGDDVLNLTINSCQSGANKCSLYWGWTYNQDTHFCVLQGWLYGIIPIIWICIMIILLIFVNSKLWIDHHIHYTAIKV